MSKNTENHVVVVGIGAMGGGMARALLDSPATNIVVGYDRSTDAVEKFFQESKAANKAGNSPPSSLRESISDGMDFVILSLVNESQCEQVCFGDGENLVNLMPKGSCVILTSTVTGKSDKNFVLRIQEANKLTST
jgi:3-hydroxyisobutyrate dehydrogenase-like beta-hydroxyacid dehydrogenase